MRRCPIRSVSWYGTWTRHGRWRPTRAPRCLTAHHCKRRDRTCHVVPREPLTVHMRLRYQGADFFGDAGPAMNRYDALPKP